MSARSWDSEDIPSCTALAAAVSTQAGAAAIDLAVVLGSGWSLDLDGATRLATFPYAEWAYFPPGQIAGHAGRLELISWHDRRILAFCGRWHYYQGLSAFAVTAPVRLAAALGVPRLLLTCATGGINPDFRAGDFMLVADHLNLLGDNPLRGRPGNNFIDLSALYRTEHFPQLSAALTAAGGRLHRGVLAAMPGPSYETPAEIAMLRRCGADAVGMSSVPEAIMARSLGLDTVALALIANPAAGLQAAPIDHAEVLACGARHADLARTLLSTLCSCWLS